PAPHARAASSLVGVHDRDPSRDRRAPQAQAGGATPRAPDRGHSARLRGARPPHRRPPRDGACGGRPSLRLRPGLLRHRNGARLERGSGPAGRVLGSPTPAQEDDMTVPAHTDTAFRDRAAAEALLDVAYDLTDSPIGPLLVAATDRGVCEIAFDPDPEEEVERLARLHGARVLRSPRPV